MAINKERCYVEYLTCSWEEENVSSKDHSCGLKVVKRTMKKFQKFPVSCIEQTSSCALYRLEGATTHVVNCFVNTASVVEDSSKRY